MCGALDVQMSGVFHLEMVAKVFYINGKKGVKIHFDDYYFLAQSNAKFSCFPMYFLTFDPVFAFLIEFA